MAFRWNNGPSRLSAERRDGETVNPLEELNFDLVFVLGFTNARH